MIPGNTWTYSCFFTGLFVDFITCPATNSLMPDPSLLKEKTYALFWYPKHLKQDVFRTKDVSMTSHFGGGWKGTLCFNLPRFKWVTWYIHIHCVDLFLWLVSQFLFWHTELNHRLQVFPFATSCTWKHPGGVFRVASFKHTNIPPSDKKGGFRMDVALPGSDSFHTPNKYSRWFKVTLLYLLSPNVGGHQQPFELVTSTNPKRTPAELPGFFWFSEKRVVRSDDPVILSFMLSLNKTTPSPSHPSNDLGNGRQTLLKARCPIFCRCYVRFREGPNIFVAWNSLVDYKVCWMSTTLKDKHITSKVETRTIILNSWKWC